MLKFCSRPFFLRPIVHRRAISDVPPRPLPATKAEAIEKMADDLVTASPKRDNQPGVVEDESYASWIPNTVYDPQDFLKGRRLREYKRTAAQLVGPGAKEARKNDAFIQLNIDPIREANNPYLFTRFLTSMGKIRPRRDTGLSWRSQRKVTKAIKRSKQKGVMPILHKNFRKSQQEVIHNE